MRWHHRIDVPILDNFPSHQRTLLDMCSLFHCILLDFVAFAMKLPCFNPSSFKIMMDLFTNGFIERFATKRKPIMLIVTANHPIDRRIMEQMNPSCHLSWTPLIYTYLFDSAIAALSIMLNSASKLTALIKHITTYCLHLLYYLNLLYYLHWLSCLYCLSGLYCLYWLYWLYCLYWLYWLYCLYRLFLFQID